MLRHLARHVRANAVAYAALFVALGGTATAATYVVSSNSQIGPGTIDGNAHPRGAHDNITNYSIAGADLASGAVSNAKLGADAVKGGKVADGSLTGADVDASTLGPVPDERNVYRISYDLPATAHFNETLFDPDGSDFDIVGGCFNLGSGGDMRLAVAPTGNAHGAATVNSSFTSSLAWPTASPNPSQLHVGGADITNSADLFFETDQNQSGDQYVGTVILNDDDQTLTLQLLVYTSGNGSSGGCQVQGTAVLKSGAPFSPPAARRSSAARDRRTSRSGG